jgi:hypothetical protein
LIIVVAGIRRVRTELRHGVAFGIASSNALVWLARSSNRLIASVARPSNAELLLEAYARGAATPSAKSRQVRRPDAPARAFHHTNEVGRARKSTSRVVLWKSHLVGWVYLLLLA